MTLTLLLDLDDTLLDSNLDAFIPTYFKALSKFLADQVESDVMLPALMSGTRKMMTSSDPARTLKQVFDAEFFPKLGVDQASFQARIDQFYEDVFPTLQAVTCPRPEAVDFVEWAFAQGYYVAIATNPIFPLKAIHHRMRWAGLAPEDYPFDVVSSYETFHFSKPHPAYFAEVLGRIGWPDTSVIMVGDDVERDLVGAQLLGLPSYWVETPAVQSLDGVKPVGHGSIADVRPWLESTDLSTLEPDFSSPDSLLGQMLSTPAIVQGLLAPLPASQWSQRPEPEEWSLTEIICHLRDTDSDVNLPRLERILGQDDPFIQGRNTDLWAEERDYISQDTLQALSGFMTARLQTLDILKGLSQAEWQRKARHAIFGPTHLQELVKFMANHDRLHIRQFWTTIQQVMEMTEVS